MKCVFRIGKVYCFIFGGFDSDIDEDNDGSVGSGDDNKVDVDGYFDGSDCVGGNDSDDYNVNGSDGGDDDGDGDSDIDGDVVICMRLL